MQINRIFLLIGKNISTSLSPLLHNKLFQLKNKKQYHYQLHDQNYLPTLEELRKYQKYGGISITIPFKKQYERYNKERNVQLIYKGQFAKHSKIINTLTLQNNKFMGYNTDIFGIQMTLKSANITGNILLLGAGATAQTFCYYFQKIPACQNIIVYNRSIKKIEQLAGKYSKVVNINEYTMENNGLAVDTIVNSLPTTVLKQNKNTYSQIITKLIQQQKDKPLIYMDVNYRSKQRIIQSISQKIRNKIIQYNGLDMLIWQAILQNYYFCQLQDKQYIQNKQDQNKRQQYFQILKKQVIGKIVHQ